MMTRYKLLFTFLYFAFVSCAPSKGEADRKFKDFKDVLLDSTASIETIEAGTNTTRIKLLEFSGPSNLINTEEFIDQTKFVALETTRESLISAIEKITIYNGRIYILDNVNRSFLIFNEVGKFVKKVGSYGRGPGEFINPINFFINEKKEELLILDDKASKILKFSLTGDFLDEKYIGFRFNDFMMLNDTTYAVNTDTRINKHNPALQNFKLLTTDTLFNVTARGNLYDANACGNVTFSRDGLYMGSSGLLYAPTFSNAIYCFQGTNIYPKYIFDVGNMQLPDFFECGLSADEFSERYNGLDSKYTYIDQPIVESVQWLTTTFRYKGMHAFMYYHKGSGRVYWNMLCKDNANTFTHLTPIKGLTKGGLFYGYTNTLALLDNYDQYRKIGGKSIAQFDTIDRGDNPVVVFYDLKK